jgi:1A family penicillin-binding protein
MRHAFPPDQRFPKSRLKRLGYFLVLCGFIAILTGSGYAFYWLQSIGVFNLDATRIKELTHTTYSDNTLVYDRSGRQIGEFFDRYQIFTPLKEIPVHLVDAILAIEDRMFYEHRGVDPYALLRAAKARIEHGRFTQGGSTITQQIVKGHILTSERTIKRKVREIAWAVKMERHLSKAQILEIYMNSMFLGNGAYGVGAAARRYFNKDVRDLSLAESALIAGLFQSPSRYNPARYPDRAKQRQRAVIAAMHAAGSISQEDAKRVEAEPLTYTTYKPMNYEKSPWFIDHIRELSAKLLLDIESASNDNAKSPLLNQGLRIHTTLDSSLQDFAERAVLNAAPSLLRLEKQTGSILDSSTRLRRPSRIEAAMLVTDPRSGEVLAMLGGRNYKASQFNRTTMALRSPGSAFKPVVYTEALMRGWKWSDVIYVSPINIKNYKPRSVDQDLMTETTMLRAFYKSMNTPAVEIASRIGLGPVISRAKSLGIRSPIKNEFGSTLGSSEVTMLDMARMYGTFANSGDLVELSSITKITTSSGEVIYQSPAAELQTTKALTQQISFLMTTGMQSVLSHGTGSRTKDLANIAAGKTGTSNHSADNWFCGYTDSLTAIVWVGTDEQAPIYADVTGGAIALPIWQDFMMRATVTKPAKGWPVPQGILTKAVHPLYGHTTPNGIRMWFLESNPPSSSPSALEALERGMSGDYRRVFSH